MITLPPPEPTGKRALRKPAGALAGRPRPTHRKFRAAQTVPKLTRVRRAQRESVIPVEKLAEAAPATRGTLTPPQVRASAGVTSRTYDQNHRRARPRRGDDAAGAMSGMPIAPTV
jgi:hypothetical protein